MSRKIILKEEALVPDVQNNEPIYPATTADLVLDEYFDLKLDVINRRRKEDVDGLNGDIAGLNSSISNLGNSLNLVNANINLLSNKVDRIELQEVTIEIDLNLNANSPNPVLNSTIYNALLNKLSPDSLKAVVSGSTSEGLVKEGVDGTVQFKTINGESILGTSDITVAGSGGSLHSYSQANYAYSAYATSDNISTPPSDLAAYSGWSTGFPTVDPDKPHLWARIAYYAVEGDHYASPTYTYARISGPLGEVGESADVSMTVFAFTRTLQTDSFISAMSLYTPLGGAYDGNHYPNAATLTVDGVNYTITWHDGIPNMTNNDVLVWMTKAELTSDGSSSGWSIPMIMLDTDTMDIEYWINEGLEDYEPIGNIYKSTYATDAEFRLHTSFENKGHWSNNPVNDQEESEEIVWMAVSYKVGNTWMPWTYLKIKGERGEAGTSITFKGRIDDSKYGYTLPQSPSDGDLFFLYNHELEQPLYDSMPTKGVILIYDSTYTETTPLDSDGEWTALDGTQDECWRYYHDYYNAESGLDPLVGDCYLVNGYLYIFDGDDWDFAGKIEGEPGLNSYAHVKYANICENGASAVKTATYDGVLYTHTGQITLPDGSLKWLRFTETNNRYIGEAPGDYMGLYFDTRVDDGVNINNNYLWRKFDGDDGFGYEHIFCTTTTNNAPHVPYYLVPDVKDSVNFANYRTYLTDDHVPNTTNASSYIYDNVVWHDNAPTLDGVNAVYRWRCTRKSDNKHLWGPFKGRSDDWTIATYDACYAESAHTYKIIPSVSNIYKYKDGTYSAANVLFNAFKRIGNQAATSLPVTAMKCAYADHPNDFSTFTAGSGSSNPSNPTAAMIDLHGGGITVQLIVDNLIVDTVSVYVLEAGVDGANGTNGTNGTSPLLLLSSAYVIPITASVDNNGDLDKTVYAVNKTLNINLYEGSENVTSRISRLSAVGTDNNTYVVNPKFTIDNANNTVTIQINANTSISSIPAGVVITAQDSSNAVLGTCQVQFSYAQRGYTGPMGKTGAFVYACGTWNSTSTYVSDTNTIPLVYHEPSEKYYYMCPVEIGYQKYTDDHIGTYDSTNVTYSVTGLEPGIGDGQYVWTEVTNYEAIYTKLLFANFARLGKAVFYGPYMFSEYGTINGIECTYSASFLPVGSGGNISTDVKDNIFVSDPPVFKFKLNGSEDAFIPYLYFDLSDGSGLVAGGKIAWEANGNVNITGQSLGVQKHFIVTNTYQRSNSSGLWHWSNDLKTLYIDNVGWYVLGERNTQSLANFVIDLTNVPFAEDVNKSVTLEDMTSPINYVEWTTVLNSNADWVHPDIKCYCYRGTVGKLYTSELPYMESYWPIPVILPNNMKIKNHGILEFAWNAFPIISRREFNSYQVSFMGGHITFSEDDSTMMNVDDHACVSLYLVDYRDQDAVTLDSSYWYYDPTNNDSLYKPLVYPTDTEIYWSAAVYRDGKYAYRLLGSEDYVGFWPVIGTASIPVIDTASYDDEVAMTFFKENSYAAYNLIPTSNVTHLNILGILDIPALLRVTNNLSFVGDTNPVWNIYKKISPWAGLQVLPDVEVPPKESTDTYYGVVYCRDRVRSTDDSLMASLVETYPSLKKVLNLCGKLVFMRVFYVTESGETIQYIQFYPNFADGIYYNQHGRPRTECLYIREPDSVYSMYRTYKYRKSGDTSSYYALDNN